jgi:hypothetical protein
MKSLVNETNRGDNVEQDDMVPGGFHGSTKSFFCDCQLSEQLPLDTNLIATHLRLVHNYQFGRSMGDARDIVIAAKLRLAAGGPRDRK